MALSHLRDTSLKMSTEMFSREVRLRKGDLECKKYLPIYTAVYIQLGCRLNEKEKVIETDKVVRAQSSLVSVS